MNPGDLDRVKRMIAEAENGPRRGMGPVADAVRSEGAGDAA